MCSDGWFMDFAFMPVGGVDISSVQRFNFFSPFHAGVEWTSARVHRFIFSPLCAKWHKIQFLKFEKENKKCAVFLFY
jgi:hypothetical protein